MHSIRATNRLPLAGFTCEPEQAPLLEFVNMNVKHMNCRRSSALPIAANLDSNGVPMKARQSQCSARTRLHGREKRAYQSELCMYSH